VPGGRWVALTTRHGYYTDTSRIFSYKEVADFDYRVLSSIAIICIDEATAAAAQWLLGRLAENVTRSKVQTVEIIALFECDILEWIEIE
jgi:hypothetical protein